jgi:high-affinity Fe2+/Pb2+ permease
MMVLGLVFAALAGIAIARGTEDAEGRRCTGCFMLLLAGGMAVLSSRLFWQPCDEEDNVDAQIASFSATGFEGTDEYTPQGSDNSEIQQGLPLCGC